MHGIIVQVKVDPAREDEARRMLREMTGAGPNAYPGLATGYWLRGPRSDVLRSVLLFDSESAAGAAAETIRSGSPPPGAPLTLDSVDVCEVPGLAPPRGSMLAGLEAWA